MAGGIQITSNATAVRGAFKAYVQYNRRDQDFLWRDQSRKLANDLYNATAEIAPTRAQIANDVKALGWHIPKYMPGGVRLGRGVPANWLGFAFTKMRRRVKRRGRRSKADHLEEADYMAQKPTLQMMQQFVISLRDKARLFLASGWLGAVVDLGGSVKASSGSVHRDRGGARIRRPAPGLIEIEFWNRTPGIEDMDAKHHFVAKALATRAADIWQYVRERQRALISNFKAAA